MRNQQKIYVQNASTCVRNSDILNVNMSSDFCTFSEPRFNVTGATKIIEDPQGCDFSGTNYDDIIVTAITECSGQTCFESLAWDLEINEDGTQAYSANVTTSIATANTITQTQVNNATITGFNTLGYDYTYTGSTFSIQKPYGVETLTIDLCIDITLSGACTGGCDTLCVELCENIYDVLTTGDTGVYIINTATTIDLGFQFTANTDSFIDNDATFKYEVYKYNHNNGSFTNRAVYTSDEIAYSTFSGTSALTESIPVSGLTLDGDYLIKGYYTFDYCTEFFDRLGVENNTLNKNGDKYGLYKKAFDYYFVGVNSADTPTFTFGDTDVNLGTLYGFSYFPQVSGQTGFTMGQSFVGSPIVALNGLTLAEGFDYQLSNSSNTLTISAGTELDDVITIVLVTDINNAVGLVNDLLQINSTISSGVTGGEGTNSVYYNTTESKYEIYTTTTPNSADDIIVTLNGLMLAVNIDYYQSITNPKRIILNGDLSIGDVVNIYYNGQTQFVGNVFNNTSTLYWNITTPPTNNDGIFTVEVANEGDTLFSSLVTTATTEYVTNQTAYSGQITLSGDVGTNYIYRVKNEKRYTTVVGDKIITINYSETIPIQIQSNAINSY